MSSMESGAARNDGEIDARREAARSLVGHQASTATKHGGNSRRRCFETCRPEYQSLLTLESHARAGR
jgi:hypothetical protein